MKKLCYLLLLIYGIASAQNVNIPDANFKAKLLAASSTELVAIGATGYVSVDTNSDGEIQVSEALVITGLQFQGGGITDFSGIENFQNLTSFGCYSNSVVDFHLNGLNQLDSINIVSNSGLNTVFNFENLPALQLLTFTYSNITSLTITNLTNVLNLSIYSNSNLVGLNLIELTSLNKINAFDCNIATLSITNSPNLTEIDFSNSELNDIPVANYPLLKKLNLNGNNISDTSGFANLNNLEDLKIGANNITDLVLPVLPALKSLTCYQNSLATINLSNFPALNFLNAGYCGISNFNFSSNPLLSQLVITNNNVSSLDFSNTPLIGSLSVGSNPIVSLNLSNLAWLQHLSCESTLISELDLSNNPLFINMSYENNPNLTHINLKSGTINNILYGSSSYYNLPNLAYICVDEGDTFTYVSSISPTPTVPISSYCSFTPGGNYNTITGNIKYDYNNNGCDANDVVFPNIRVNINDPAQMSGASFTNNSGNYTFFTQAGTFALTTDMENPTWFNFSPVTADVVFADNNNNTATQDFCITPNGLHLDIETVISPLTNARPGFDAVYKLVIKNKGNQTQSGLLSFTYNEATLDYVSSSQLPEIQSEGAISWYYGDLLPFESRSILVTLNVNSPTETPAVNIGDVLNYSLFSYPSEIDETPADNQFTYNQTVVGSFDPNDITCLEGELLPPSTIGNYLHYAVNFENTGNYPAENVVVKIDIDPTKFDVNSLQLLNTSHPVDARITGNKVEFIFENIYLDTNGHGHILLKIKSRDTVVSGETVTKRADIFFDYNFPVDTGMASTTFQTLSNAGFELDDSIGIYPNPTSSKVTINSNFNIKSIQVYDIQGRILETIIGNNKILDITDKANGVYFLKITTKKGSKIEKVVKE